MKTIIDEKACPYCSKLSFDLVQPETGQVVHPHCNRPLVCQRAAAYYARRLRKRLEPIHWRTFVTLTMPPGAGEPRQPNLRTQSQALTRLLKRLRRQNGAFHYAWVREHVNGRLHVHALLTIPGLDADALSPIAEQCGLGPVVHILPINDSDHRSRAIDYLTKSLTQPATDQTPAWPRKTRRVQTSLPKGRKHRSHWLKIPKSYPHRRSISDMSDISE
jgi:hypothetical protein